MRAGNEDDLVTVHGCLELFDLFPMPGLCPHIYRFSCHRPSYRLRINIEEDGREATILVAAMDRSSEREGMLEELRCIQVAVEVRLAAQTVANAFVSFHVFAPDRTPVGGAQWRGPLGPVRLKSLGLDADERRRCRHETIENGMPPAAPWEANLGFQSQRKGRPCFAITARQGWQIRYPIEEEAERVGREGRGGFRTVELPGCNFVAGSRVECCLDFRAWDPRQEPSGQCRLPRRVRAHENQALEGIANVPARVGELFPIAA